MGKKLAVAMVAAPEYVREPTLKRRKHEFTKINFWLDRPEQWIPELRIHDVDVSQPLEESVVRNAVREWYNSQRVSDPGHRWTNTILPQGAIIHGATEGKSRVKYDRINRKEKILTKIEVQISYPTPSMWMSVRRGSTMLGSYISADDVVYADKESCEAQVHRDNHSFGCPSDFYATELPIWENGDEYRDAYLSRY